MFKIGIILITISILVSVVIPGPFDIGLLPLFVGIGLVLTDE